MCTWSLSFAARSGALSATVVSLLEGQGQEQRAATLNSCSLPRKTHMTGLEIGWTVGLLLVIGLSWCHPLTSDSPRHDVGGAHAKLRSSRPWRGKQHARPAIPPRQSCSSASRG